MTSSTRDKNKAQSVVLSLMEAGEKAVGAKVVEVTPAVAQVLLDMNPNNRSLKPSKIDQYARDMAEGRFVGLNGETIILAKTGELNDGQNRLSAIAKSGLKQFMLIAFGVDRDSRYTVDLGTARTAGDALKLQGHAYGNTIAAAARRIIAYKTTGSFQQTGRISTVEAVKMGETDKRLGEASQWAQIHQKEFRPFGLAASEVAMLRYLFEEIAPKGEWKGFFNQLGTGIGLTADSPVLYLRNKLQRDKYTLAARAELVVKAWNHYIRDEPTSKYQVVGKVPDIRKPKAKPAGGDN